MAGSQTFRASVILSNLNSSQIVFDFSYADPGSVATHLDTGIAAGNFQTLVEAVLASALPSTTNIIKYRFATVSGPFAGEIGYVVRTTPLPGGISSLQTLPNEIAISMKRNTGHASRSDRGRFFFGPIDVTFQEPTNPDLVIDTGSLLPPVTNLSTTSLVTGGVTLTPALLDSAHAWNGHALVNSSVGPVFVHRRTRRFGIGS